jgi:hypothetical protein
MMRSFELAIGELDLNPLDVLAHDPADDYGCAEFGIEVLKALVVALEKVECVLLQGFSFINFCH